MNFFVCVINNPRLIRTFDTLCGFYIVVMIMGTLLNVCIETLTFEVHVFLVSRSTVLFKENFAFI